MMVNFLCPLSGTTVPRYLVKHSLQVAMKVFCTVTNAQSSRPE